MTNIITGFTTHARFKPKKHVFSYPLYMLGIEISSLPQLNKTFFTGYNKQRVLSVFDSDYLDNSDQTLGQKVDKLTQHFSHKNDIKKTVLITIPRLFFKTFRPVSFYMCYGEGDEYLGMFAEVTNTYKESYFYTVEQNGDAQRVVVDKNFHVSPFFEEKGEYEFSVYNTDSRLEIGITYIIDGEKVFYADFKGNKKHFNGVQLTKLLILYPLTALLVFPRILIQAFCLSFIKKIKHYSKPELKGESVLRNMPLSIIQKKVLKTIKEKCKHLEKGKLDITLLDKSSMSLGSSLENVQAKMTILNNNFFNSIKSSGEIGLGESYIRGEWDSSKVESVVEFMIANKQKLEQLFNGNILIKMLNVVKHRLRRNSKKNSKKNIAEHYDLGNDFYQLFLDETMMYSSGLFSSESDSLEKAQKQKVSRLIDGLKLKKNDHVLEIGSGWGYTAVEMAKRYQCKVTTVTLSEEQLAYTQNLIEKEKLTHLVEVKLQDYRLVEGHFDAIVSIEMIEAVGHEFLQQYFEVCNALLKPGGRFALQSITYPQQSYKEYCGRTDFIRKHIFPGGHLPSVELIMDILDKNTTLKTIESLNIAQSYATTLSKWKQTFIDQKESLFNQGFDEYFFRKWIYYFSYCEAAFRSDFLGCYQFHFEKGE
ncbi:hypothetical protein DID78_03475 [Candidatus Marinamargulisbacteria bacterium SCGC AG-343-D04]|nr:hypothetical protein DID78_03475 [Candidatus Marinamargulisbacteria bacterium SCGC AG-343-D04]